MIYDSEIFSPLQSSISPQNQVQIWWFLIPWNWFEVIFYNLHFPQFLSSIHRPIWSILKNTSRISLFTCGFDPYLPLYHSIRVNFPKLVISVLFLTRDRLKSTTSRSCPVTIPPWWILDGLIGLISQITLQSISFILIKMKFSHCHSCVFFLIKSMRVCND